MTTREQRNAAALPDLLALLYADHGYWEQIISAMRSDGSPELEGCAPEEGPWGEILALRNAYRLDDIDRALQALYRRGHPFRTWAAAVYHEYVLPCAEWHPHYRQVWARVGIIELAHAIPGELLPFVPMRQPTREERIRGMRDQGESYSRIAQAVRCSKREVAAVVKGKRSLSTVA